MNNNKPVWSYFLIGVMMALFVSICACFAIISTGYVDTRRIVIYSGSAEKAYDGAPLSSMQYGVLSGTLKEGHTLVAMPYGSQTEVGKSRNLFHYAIVDKDGSSVTDEYRVIEAPGYLFVHEEGWIDWDKIDDLQKYIDRFGNLDINVSGLDVSDPNLGDIVKEIDWESLELEEKEKKLAQMGAMLAAASTSNPEDFKEILEEMESSATGESGDSTTVGPSGKFNNNLQNEGKGFDENAEEEILKVFTENSGEYYLRCESFGDYNGSGFDNAKAYINNIVSPLYFAGTTIFETAKDSFETIKIENLDGLGTYYLPYYSITGATSDYSDVRVSKKSDAYQVKAFAYDYINSEENYSMSNEKLSLIEQKYREHVYKNYLTIDENLKTQLINLTGFSSSGKQLAADVKNYVQNAATYNLYHDKFPDGEDMVLYFLTQAKEGICQHFAASATMIFRAYGIPARYTCGYKATTMAGEWTVVTGKYGHAWVEIYVDGFGWVQVEVTGGAYDTVRTNDIVIKSIDATKQYDGKPFEFDAANFWQVVSGSIPSTHRIEAVQKSGVEVPKLAGEYANDCFDYRIVDVATGKDVTDRYNITEVSYGELSITKTELTVFAGSNKYEYTGKGISHAVIDTEKTEGISWLEESNCGLIESTGDYIHVSEKTVQTEIGTYVNHLTYYVLSPNNENVTDQYIITENDGELEITKIEIKVITTSYKHEFDGKYAIKEEYIINDAGQLLDSHYSIAVVGSTEAESLIKEVGQTAKNKFEVKIYDRATNQDVTDAYYVIEYDYGDIEVIKRPILIITGSDTQEYGVAPAKNETPAYVDNLVDGHRLVVDGEVPTRTNPGWQYNECKYKVLDEHGEDISHCYEISYNEDEMLRGVLKVYIAIIITTETETFEYNHLKEHSAKDNPTTSPALMEGHRLEVVSFIEKTACGEYSNICTYRVVDQTNNDVTEEYYKLSYDYGTLKIAVSNPTKLTLTTQGASKAYDGKKLTVPNKTYTLTGSLRQGHELVVEYNQGITNVSSSPCIKKVKVIDKETKQDVTAYYSITKKGYLTITQRKIEFKTEDRTYYSWDDAIDGKFYGKAEDLTILTGALVEGHTPDVQMNYITREEVENNGYALSKDNTALTIKIKDANGNDVTKNYLRVIKEIGELSVVII